jgi:hypothetical protein
MFVAQIAKLTFEMRSTNIDVVVFMHTQGSAGFLQEPGGVSDCESIVKAMRTYGSDVEIQGHGCQALGNLSARQNGSMPSGLDSTAFTAVINAIIEHPDDAQASAEGCKALAYMCINNYCGSCEDCTLAGKAAVQSLQKHMHDPGVMQWACEAVYQLIVNVSDSSASVLDINACECMMEIMHHHATSLSTSIQACRALAMIISDSEIRELDERDACKVIIGAMQQHKQSAELSHWGCIAIYHLVEYHSSKPDTADTISICEAVTHVLELHTDDELLQWGYQVVEKCGTLYSGDKIKVTNTDDCEAVVKTMRNAENTKSHVGKQLTSLRSGANTFVLLSHALVILLRGRFAMFIA